MGEGAGQGLGCTQGEQGPEGTGERPCMGVRFTVTHTCVCDTAITCVEPSLPPESAAWAWPGSSSRPFWRPLEGWALSPSSRPVPGEPVVRLTREHPLHSLQKLELGDGTWSRGSAPQCCATAVLCDLWEVTGPLWVSVLLIYKMESCVRAFQLSRAIVSQHSVFANVLCQLQSMRQMFLSLLST